MKILILHVSNTFNYGTMMMAQNLINTIQQQAKEEVSFYVDIKDEDNLNRLKEATGIQEIYIDQKMKKIEAGSQKEKIKGIFCVKKHMEEVSQFYDKIIFLGGDDFSELYARNFKDKLWILLDLRKIKYLNCEGKVILLGQTIGPYTGIKKYYAKKVFRRIKIITRDDSSYKVMKEEYNVDSEISRDLAFIDLQFQDDYKKQADEILNQYQLKKNEYVTIVGTQLIKLYTKEEKDFKEQFVEIIKKVKERFPDKKVVWLSHVTTRLPSRSDNTLLEEINHEYDNFITKNMVVIKEEMLPVKARILLGNGYMTITCRMHAAVSTFQMGKPAVCLSYSPKYEGVIGQGLQMEELIIEAKGDTIWKSQIIDKVNEKITYVQKHYEEITAKIDGNVEKCKEKARNTIIELIK